MSIKLQLIGVSLLVLASTAIAPASAATFDVFAAGNSSTGGAGAPTVFLTAGESYSVNVNPSDIWNAGALPRWSNADGLIQNLPPELTKATSHPAPRSVQFSLHGHKTDLQHLMVRS